VCFVAHENESGLEIGEGRGGGGGRSIQMGPYSNAGISIKLHMI
jgi:hypothetical protein